nr:hypothetical protein [Bradyrhizobium barranii]
MSNPVYERSNQFGFSAVANVRSADGINRPMITFEVSNNCPDADD